MYEGVGSPGAPPLLEEEGDEEEALVWKGDTAYWALPDEFYVGDEERRVVDESGGGEKMEGGFDPDSGHLSMSSEDLSGGVGGGGSSGLPSSDIDPYCNSASISCRAIILRPPLFTSVDHSPFSPPTDVLGPDHRLDPPVLVGLTGAGVETLSGSAARPVPGPCAECSLPIVDRYYLVAVGRQWHVDCLRCCECFVSLDRERTCFVREAKIYCKNDYQRLFTPKTCASCQRDILLTELVMRAPNDVIYHVDCFVCSACQKQLTTGEHFGMHDRRVYCRVHYELFAVVSTRLSGDVDEKSFSNDDDDNDDVRAINSLDGADVHAPLGRSFVVKGGVSLSAGAVFRRDSYQEGCERVGRGGRGLKQGRPRKKRLTAVNNLTSESFVQSILQTTQQQQQQQLQDPSNNNSCCVLLPPCLDIHGGNGGMFSQHHQHQLHSHPPRQKRLRTSFKHHQLRIMKTYFVLNHNPDAKDLKQLSQKTGLGKRILQVWFQNARAKFRRNVLRQERDGSSHSNVTTAPVTSSPTRRSNNGGSTINDNLLVARTTSDIKSTDSGGRCLSHSPSLSEISASLTGPENDLFGGRFDGRLIFSGDGRGGGRGERGRSDTDDDFLLDRSGASDESAVSAIGSSSFDVNFCEQNTLSEVIT